MYITKNRAILFKTGHVVTLIKNNTLLCKVGSLAVNNFIFEFVFVDSECQTSVSLSNNKIIILIKSNNLDSRVIDIY